MNRLDNGDAAQKSAITVVDTATKTRKTSKPSTLLKRSARSASSAKKKAQVCAIPLEQRLTVLSIDVGMRRPGIVCTEFWRVADADTGETHLRFRPKLMRADPVIPSEFSKPTAAETTEFMVAYFERCAATLFDPAVNVYLIEHQLNHFNKMMGVLSHVMQTCILTLYRKYNPEATVVPPVFLVTASRKTTGASKESTASKYGRKDVVFHVTQGVLKESGYLGTAANIANHESRFDMSDAFFMAYQWLCHQWSIPFDITKYLPEAPVGKRKRTRRTKVVSAAICADMCVADVIRAVTPPETTVAP